MNIQMQAVEYILISKKHGLKATGKDPKGLAAAAIYMASKNNNEKLTQTQIAGVARITEVTLQHAWSKYNHASNAMYLEY